MMIKWGLKYFSLSSVSFRGTFPQTNAAWAVWFLSLKRQVQDANSKMFSGNFVTQMLWIRRFQAAVQFLTVEVNKNDFSYPFRPFIQPWKTKSSSIVKDAFWTNIELRSLIKASFAPNLWKESSNLQSVFYGSKPPGYSISSSN